MKKLILIFIITFIISFFPLKNYDFFWHLKTGEFIFKNGIPEYDPFSYNSKGKWINHAWLYDLILYLIIKFFNFHGIFIFKYFLTFLSGLLIFLICREKNFSFFFALSIIFYSLSISRHRLDVRPDSFSIFLFLILLYLLQKEKYKFVPFLLIIWVNFHASFIFALFFSTIYFFYLFLKEKNKNFLIILALSLIFPILNPFTYKAYILPVLLSFKVKTLSLINPEWLSAPFIPFLPFYFSTFFIILILIFEKNEKFKKILYLPTTGMALISLRFHPFFAVSFPFFLEKEKKPFKYLFFIFGFFALIFSLKFYSFFGYGFDKVNLPINEVNFLKKINYPENLFCSPGYGGYLIFNFYPEKKVFWDGRNELYFHLLEEFSKSLKSKEKWENFLRKYKINSVIIKYQGYQKFKINGEIFLLPWSVVYFPENEWDLIFWDDSGMVFTRKNLNQFKTFKFNPEGVEYLIGSIKNGKLKKEEVIKEMEEKISQNPKCKRAKKILKEIKKLN